MIVKNPNYAEVEKTFSQFERKANAKIMTKSNGGKHWATIKSMTSFFDLNEINVFNKAKMNKFKNSGWIEYRIFMSPKINAFASTYNELQYLGFNFGLLYSIRDTFMSLFSTKEFLPEIGDSKNEISNIYDFQESFIYNRNMAKYFNLIPKCKTRQQCADSMTNLALIFVYMHEVLHLAQCHSILHKNLY